MARTIPLTQGRVAVVDDEDFEWLSQWKWRLHAGRYASRKRRRADGPGSDVVLMHREILGTPEGLDTDHINRDGLDNRRANLRACTRGENNLNRRTRKVTRSGLMGVDRSENGRRWTARVTRDRVVETVGVYDCRLAAAAARDARAVELHGEFAQLNFAEPPRPCERICAECRPPTRHRRGSQNPERDGRIVALRTGGLGPRQIARELRLAPGVVLGVLFRAGLTGAA